MQPPMYHSCKPLAPDSPTRSRSRRPRRSHGGLKDRNPEIGTFTTNCGRVPQKGRFSNSGGN
eukprot:3814271-Rhodomonas_salina.2